MQIEPAQPADAPAMAELLRRSGLPQDGIADHLATALVVHDGATIVGCAALERYGEHALLRSVAVDAHLRGQGWGQRLTHAALDLARTAGVRKVYLLTETASAFFPRWGVPSDCARCCACRCATVGGVHACLPSQCAGHGSDAHVGFFLSHISNIFDTHTWRSP